MPGGGGTFRGMSPFSNHAVDALHGSTLHNIHSIYRCAEWGKYGLRSKKKKRKRKEKKKERG